MCAGCYCSRVGCCCSLVACSSPSEAFHIGTIKTAAGCWPSSLLCHHLAVVVCVGAPVGAPVCALLTCQVIFNWLSYRTPVKPFRPSVVLLLVSVWCSSWGAPVGSLVGALWVLLLGGSCRCWLAVASGLVRLCRYQVGGVVSRLKTALSLVMISRSELWRYCFPPSRLCLSVKIGGASPFLSHGLLLPL